MNVKIIVAPTAELLSLSEVKNHLRITSNTEDDLITLLIKTAREYAENYTRRALASATFELILDEFPSCKIILPKSPVESITSIKYKDYSGIEATWEASKYIFYNDEPAIIVPAYGEVFPSFTPYPKGAVKIRFVAGYKASSADPNLLIPEPIKQAMKLTIGHLYENREAVNVGNIVTKLPFSVESLLYPYRVWSL